MPYQLKSLFRRLVASWTDTAKMHFGSDNYELYESRLRIFTKKVENHLVDEMLRTLGEEKVKDWVAECLTSLHEYILERDFHKQGNHGDKCERYELGNNKQGI